MENLFGAFLKETTTKSLETIFVFSSVYMRVFCSYYKEAVGGSGFLSAKLASTWVPNLILSVFEVKFPKTFYELQSES